MAYVPAPQIAQTEIRALQAGQKIENRIMVDALTPITPVVLADIAGLVLTWASSTYFLNVTNNVSLTEVVSTDLTTQNGSQISAQPSIGVAGTAGENPMPNESAFCVSLRSSARGRSARGRFYAFGLDKELVVANEVAGSYRTAIVGALNSLISVLDTNGYALVVVSFVANGAPRVGGPVYFPITSAVSVDATVDSMKSRKPGVGS